MGATHRHPDHPRWKNAGFNPSVWTSPVVCRHRRQARDWHRSIRRRSTTGRSHRYLRPSLSPLRRRRPTRWPSIFQPVAVRSRHPVRRAWHTFRESAPAVSDARNIPARVEPNKLKAPPKPKLLFHPGNMLRFIHLSACVRQHAQAGRFIPPRDGPGLPFSGPAFRQHGSTDNSLLNCILLFSERSVQCSLR